ncbi:hypothetical protein EV198_3003 [Roseivirga ehrenbergii]|uniref:Uncharacterized protein n=1 Tax=Roseivirga ehrenbergii (strain DSM 102268 / JCM 13514 / KCTC 12282 / NCIMB 14502 / KMM 6017) TaxID=279360 RepID=A0A150XQR9_ROSEK|nr:hypothetical protein [Roseivirga ehrenbergii]KYG81108.1 hypothetical protein MB14_15150 [Roseivirga ehrenbergii]TCL00986.1 hypothetical protein EV198_3003 [Roseivirga ehrenbergii]
MTLFIHLQIKPIEQIQFSNEWVGIMKTEFPDALIFEADSHSEPFVISQGVSFLKEAEKVVLFLDSDENEKLGACAPLIEKVLRDKAIAPFILIQGQNVMFEKMAKMMKKEVFRYESVEESLVQISRFLN